MAFTDARQAVLVLLLSFAAAAAPAAFAQANGQKLVQCWTDDRGHRACGDALPPAEARRQRELIDRRGVTQKVVPAQKSAAQAEADVRLQQAREQREAYDRYLLQAFQSVGEMEKVRDERLNTLDGRQRLAEKTLNDTGMTLADLRKRQAATPNADPKLKDMITEYTSAETDQIEAIARIRRERARISADFERDIERYRVLRAEARG